MPHRIALLSRYPPLEGGISSKTYWLARGLTTRGNQVHVITHPTKAAGQYRILDSDISCHDIPNLWVHRPEVDTPWHLPEDNEYFVALLDLTLDVVRQYGIEIIDTGYLVPFGLIGHVAKLITGVRHVLRHGGSDVEKFLRPGVFGTVLLEAISNTDAVITQDKQIETWRPRNRNVVVQPAYIPDASVFAALRDHGRRPRLAVIGKINFHWEHKSLRNVAEIMGRLTERFECWVIGQGNGLQDFQRSLDNTLVSALEWHPFVPPWEMPELLGRLDAIFILESGLPHPIFSNLALEAMCAGVGIITDRDDFASTYRDFMNFGDDQILVIPKGEPSLAAEQITKWVKQRALRPCPVDPVISYEEYIAMNQELYETLLS